MVKVYALANQKGGVGKTTTAINLAAYLAVRSKRTLIVDMDPQANATSSLGLDKQTITQSVYDALVREMPLDGIVRPAGLANLDVAPSSLALAGAEIELVPTIGREYRLKEALAGFLNRYDYILLDGPPSLGLLTVNALTAAHGVLIPVQCEYLPLEGLGQLIRTVDLVRQRLNPGLNIYGLVMTMLDSRTNLGQQVVEEVRAHFPQQVFRTIIPRSVRLSEAPSHGQTILQYAPASSGGLAYQALAEEVLARDAMETDIEVKS